MGIIYKNGIPYGNQPSIDATLTHQGEAADAKAAGDAVSELRNTLNHKADVIYDTASGDIASFPDGAYGLPVKDLTVAIEPVQAGTGDPSPDNVRPISGWTGCNISHSGADTSDPTVIPISWQSSAGTVYGGTLDVTSGMLTVDRKFISFNGGWTIASTGVLYVDGSASDGTASGDLFACNMYPFGIIGSGTAYALSYPKTVCLQTLDGVRFMIYDTTYTTAQQFNDFLANNPLQIVYKLATPQTYQLTPTEVTTLLGQNNIWADCGPSTVEYPCDTKLYIERLTAPEEDDMIANQNIASGKYFMIGNNLYLSTTTIPAGDTINPGTNCTATNLAAALNALNS